MTVHDQNNGAVGAVGILLKMMHAEWAYCQKNIGFAYLSTDCVDNETKLMVEEGFGEMVLAKIVPDVLYDPESEAIRR